MRKRIWGSFAICLFIFLVSCQSSDQNKEEAGSQKADNNEQNNNENEQEEDPYPYSLDPYEIEIEPEGELFTEYINDKETAEDDIYDDAQEEALDALVEEIETLDKEEYDEPEKVAGIIMNTLRTNYAADLDKVRDFEIEFDDIELPDGRPLNTLKEEDLEEDPPDTNVAVILDASGSMKAEVEGGEKMTLARESLKTFTDSLADYVDVALYVFGHEGSGDE
ncbi:MAG TPA: hypothetical protein VK108_05325, partial [Pseudogracilibacillus sp.]|nr:hypothetical protein [Pseudogracilibacillus sp.]